MNQILIPFVPQPIFYSRIAYVIPPTQRYSVAPIENLVLSQSSMLRSNYTTYQSRSQSKIVHQSSRCRSPQPARITDVLLEYDDGCIYSGMACQAERPKRRGFGILKKGSEVLYAGNWVNDKFHGFGIMVNPSVSRAKVDVKNLNSIGHSWVKYIGNFENHKMHGLGILYLQDGSKFEGWFDQGQINGSGKFTKGNEITRGTWIEGIQT